MNLQRLEGFYWVAKTQGYARAARAFPYPITQPGVYQQVRRLEEELGVALFERVGKDKVLLTPRGQLLWEAIAPFYEGLAQVEARVRGGVIGGTLRIHSGGLLLRYFMPEWLRALQAKRPEIRVALTEMRAVDLNLLRNGDTDLIVDWVPDVPMDVMFKEVTHTEAWVVAPSHGPFAQKGKLDLAGLADVPFIAYHSDRTLKALQLEALKAHDMAPREAFAGDSADTIMGFVAAGLGFSLVPMLTKAPPRIAGVVAQRLERPKADFPIYALWRKGAGPNPLIDAALEVAPLPEKSNFKAHP
jgi:DNA-binding transcriptional LysR family regulator